MKNYRYPERSTWASLCQRPTLDFTELNEKVEAIFKEIRERGDVALLEYSKQFDKKNLKSLQVDLRNIEFSIDPELADAIHLAKSNIEKFHLSQKEKPQIVETTEGVKCWRKSVPIENVGLYIPGGSAPLFSTLLMLVIPAQIAGCKEIVVCTPPSGFDTKNSSLKKGVDGDFSRKSSKPIQYLNPIIGWTCKLLGIEKVFLTGGAQAIAAMTFGTKTIPKVDKIFGPGNQYVTAAKQKAINYGVAIDMPAGPSEVLVIANDTAYPQFVAADLLSQAEHGPDSQVVLVSDSENLTLSVEEEITKQVEDLPRKSTALKALQNSQSVLVRDLKVAIAFSNEYAPEHLIIATDNAEELAEQVTNAGSVFLGNWSCESAGDYASGTNHTLPTNGFSRNHSGVSLDSFLKKITFQQLTEQGIKNLGPAIEKMAEAERLEAHKNAVSLRLKHLQNKPLPPTPSRGGDSAGQFPLPEGARGRRDSTSSKEHSFYNKNLKSKARKLRNEATIAEATLWKYVLRASGLGYPFRRQRPIGNYIADFVSLPLKLVIEVDGISHSYEEVAKKDESRQADLENLGFKVIRIPDDAILSNVDHVRNYLIEIIENLHSKPPKKGEK
ncbi:MAG: histidinol dehydrogenase [Ekhidna sp.]|uniref:histidinol dehydrogenase n=1 Tax=Ekhidna sp. TaxID=2608089 RepID=UPI0032EEF612